MSINKTTNVSTFKINCLMENTYIEAFQNNEINKNELYLTQQNWTLLFDEIIEMQKISEKHYWSPLTYSQLINENQIKIVLNDRSFICNKQDMTEDSIPTYAYGATITQNYEDMDWSIFPMILSSTTSTNSITIPISIGVLHIQVYIHNS